MKDRVLYVGVDMHEKESQMAVYERDGELLQEKKLPTKRLPKFISPLDGKEKHIGLESVGFIYPVYDASIALYRNTYKKTNHIDSMAGA